MTPEQTAFAESLHDLLAAADTPSIARAWARADHAPGLALWRQLAKLGVMELATEATPLDVVVAFEELGHHAMPGPLIESIAVAPLLDASLVARLASGEVLATVAPSFLDADVAVIHLNATPGTTPGALAVGALAVGIDPTRRLFPAPTAGAALSPGAALPPGAESGADLSGDAERGADLSSDAERGAGLSGDAARGAALDGGAAFDAGVLACAAQLHGLGRALLEMSVSHAQTRVQFGQPIGRFQAIKHKLADAHIALDFARPLLHAAALSGAPRDISAAKAACGDAAYLAARTALQVHGAIGYTAEFDLGIWFTKVRALIPAWGTPAFHRARVMASL